MKVKPPPRFVIGMTVGCIACSFDTCLCRIKVIDHDPDMVQSTACLIAGFGIGYGLIGVRT